MRTHPTSRSGSALALIAGLGLVLPGLPLEAQEEFPSEPPPPAEPADVQFPEVGRDTLANGLEVVVVENHEQPVVSVRLYVPGGEVADPEGRIGTANLVSRMIDKGTDSRSAEEIAATVEGAGASLSTGASDDYAFVATTALTDRLATVMEVFSDVVRNPTFPADGFETEKKRFTASLEQQLSQPGQLASRHFRQVVYGDHPYAEEPTPETADPIDRDDLTSFHERRYVPDGSLLVFAGDIDPASAGESAERWFGGWSGSQPDRGDYPEPPAREERALRLVHRPGSVQSSIRIGHLGLQPGSSDTYSVDVMNRILGGGANARLFLILREEKGWTYGAYSTFTDARQRGHFVAGAEVRNPVTDSAVIETLGQMDRIRSEPVGEEELADATNYLTGNFPLQIETPQQVASRVSDVLLRGLDIDYLETYRSRISEVDRQDVRRAARQHLHPDRAAIVVVGDAAAVHDGLAGIAPLTLYDTDGEEIELADLEVRRTDVTLDASRIRRGDFLYSLLYQGNSVARSTLRVEDTDAGRVRVTESLSGAMGSQTTRYVVTPELAPVRVEKGGQMGPTSVSLDLSYEDGRVKGTATVPRQPAGEEAGGQPEMEELKVDTTVAGGTVDQNMALAVILASPLEEGAELELPVYSPRTGVSQLTARVTGRETVEVEAGSFETWDVQLEVSGQTVHLFVTREAPHFLVKQTFAEQPLSMELMSRGAVGEGSPDAGSDSPGDGGGAGDAGGGSGDGGG
jgi:zinc protease